MRVKVILAFLILSTAMAYGQKFTGYVVTINNDTIKCTFSVQSSWADKTMFYPSSIKKSVNIITDSGEKKKYVPRQVKTVFVEGTGSGSYKFVSIPEDPANYYEEVIVGRFSVYKEYFDNYQGGASHVRVIYTKNNKIYELETNWKKYTKWFGEMIADYPELHQKWMDPEYQMTRIEDVIKLYNRHFAAKI